MYRNKELKDIENKTNVSLNDLYNQYPVPIGDICDKLGISVVFDDEMSDDYHGRIQYIDNKYIITVNSKHSVYNNVFTIAHELGHFIKHSDDVRKNGFADRRKSQYTPHQSKQEREANNFAASLLMPKDKFTEVFRESDGNLSILQSTFRVSLDAVKFRAMNLALLLG